jgi:hypothetical protein
MNNQSLGKNISIIHCGDTNFMKVYTSDSMNLDFVWRRKMVLNLYPTNF